MFEIIGIIAIVLLIGLAGYVYRIEIKKIYGDIVDKIVGFRL